MITCESEKNRLFDAIDNEPDMRVWGEATRDVADGKLDFEGCMSPLVDKAFGEYMLRHQNTANGLRGSDNWQSLFGEEHLDVCLKSLLRHVHDLRMYHDGFETRDGVDEAIGGIIFNANAYWYKLLLERKNDEKTKDRDLG
jgi:hypothetical protein